MEYRQFGKTDLSVSVIGFGAWGIGGGALAGDAVIGWGDVDDTVSVRALHRAYDRGINFIDTADFYGLGHSEEVIGKTFGNRHDIVIATKVGHSLGSDGTISVDYSAKHITGACEQSLRRLRRETIDLYQLHSARVMHLETGECTQAMEQLRESGKIRYWGLSLNTFNPHPEADYMMEHSLGHGLQLVLNVLNQRSLPIIRRASEAGYGLIARMPLQFGLLTGKFNASSTFAANDHRSFRLAAPLLEKLLTELKSYWDLTEGLDISKTALSLSFCASVPGISTVIPGIKTPEQADTDTAGITNLSNEALQSIIELGERRFKPLMPLLEEAG